MITITLDFETYYDVNYSLTKMPTPVYVNHDDFKVWGVGIKVEDQETVWLQPDEIEAEFDFKSRSTYRIGLQNINEVINNKIYILNPLFTFQ